MSKKSTDGRGRSAGSTLGRLKGNITQAVERGEINKAKGYIEDYNKIAKEKGHKQYEAPEYIKEVIAGYPPITSSTPFKDDEKKVKRETLKTSESKSKKAPAKAKGVKKIGSVPDVIQGKAQRGRTAVTKKGLTKDILDYEKEKYTAKKKEASKDIKIINAREEKMRNKK